MATLKTQPTDASVDDFIESVEPERRRDDARQLLKLLRRVTRTKPKLWGDSIVGFGKYHYEYDTGREGDWFRVGFSPRKANLVVYIMPGYRDYGELMQKLGKHKLGKSCLYINKLADIDLAVLEELVRESLAYLKQTYG